VVGPAKVGRIPRQRLIPMRLARLEQLVLVLTMAVLAALDISLLMNTMDRNSV